LGFDGILNQIFQPYFYYSVIFLSVTFVCVRILTKYCSFISKRTKSFLYLLPLALPLVVMFIAFPSTSIQITSQHIKNIDTIKAESAIGPFPFGPIPQAVPTISTTTFLSITGIICLIGLAVGALFALSMVLADDRLARRVLHVILLSPAEHEWLQANVAESSRKLGIASPKIGVVEDLRPNAFTIGYGKRATIVFSIGLLNILNKEEIVAVASHELAHVKNNDFFFKTISNALTTVSFFNPLSYIASSTAQREREMLADERAVELLERPSALSDALTKICRAIQNLPKESMLVNFSSSLLMSSSVLHRVGILSTHPRLDTRLRNISAPKPSKRWSKHNTQVVWLLSIMLILSVVVVGLVMADLQLRVSATFATPFANAPYLKDIPSDFKVAGFNMTSGNATFVPGIMTPAPFNGTQTIHVLVYQPCPGSNVLGGYTQTANKVIPNSQVNPAAYGYVQVFPNTPFPVWIG